MRDSQSCHLVCASAVRSVTPAALRHSRGASAVSIMCAGHQQCSQQAVFLHGSDLFHILAVGHTPERLGDERGERGVAPRQPPARRHAVGLVLELLRHHVVEVLRRGSPHHSCLRWSALRQRPHARLHKTSAHHTASRHGALTLPTSHFGVACLHNSKLFYGSCLVNCASHCMQVQPWVISCNDPCSKRALGELA